MLELIGQELGQYRITEKIGEGGMAAVFKAYQPNLERYVAIKVLPPAYARQNPVFVKRFQREAKSFAQLNHPHILAVYDYGIERDYSYIVMRYVEGAQTLARLIPLCLSDERIFDLTRQIAEALTYAHNRGIIHRDVKPSNILIDGRWALLSDFGVAKTSSAITQLTHTGMNIGTPAYMSPEQAKGEEIDHRSDIYALGVVLFEMLTRRIPHYAPTPYAIALKRATQPPPSPRSVNSAITRSVEQVVLRALAVSPSDRYDSAEELADALKKAMADDSYREPIIGTRLSHQTVNLDIPTPVVPMTPQPRSSSQKLLDTVRQPAWLTVIGIGMAASLLALLGPALLGSPEIAAHATPTQAMAALPAATIPPPPPSPSPAEPPPAPTNTPTPAPSPTPTEAVSLPAATLLVIAVTPSGTETPTATPPATRSTPLATATPSPTVTPALPSGSFTLLKPVSLDDPSYGPTTFEWEWAGSLPPEFGFEVRVWREGELPAGVHNSLLDNRAGRIKQFAESRYRFNADIREAAGVRGRTGAYLWTVGLVRIEPDYEYLGQEATPVRFRFEAGGGSSDSGDGSGGNNGNGGIN
jgi:serine/threonine protein kinase